MATGLRDGHEREIHRLDQSKCLELPNHRVSSTAEKIMKEVDILNKEEIDKERFPVRHCAHNSGKAKRVSVCKRKARQSLLSRRAPPTGRTSDMANKENELTFVEDAFGLHYNDHCLPVNSSEASRMAGAASKYGDYFTELSKDHDAMAHVLFGRNLKLNVALTLWHKNASELVAYLVRIQDTGVLIDCLPVITKSLQDQTECMSIGCCVDLLPQVKTILSSKYEEHLNVVLHWVQSVIKKWWPELSTNGKSLRDSCSQDRNVQVMKQELKALWEEGRALALVPGTTGETAKVIESYLSQLR